MRLSFPKDPVRAVVLSYPKYKQKAMWNQWDEIVEDDPSDEQ
jgi:hypothetical protein